MSNLGNIEIQNIFTKNLATVFEKVQKLHKTLLDSRIFWKIEPNILYKHSFFSETLKLRILDFDGKLQDLFLTALKPFESLEQIDFRYKLMHSQADSKTVNISILMKEDSWKLVFESFEFTQEYNVELDDEKMNRLLSYIISHIK